MTDPQIKRRKYTSQVVKAFKELPCDDKVSALRDIISVCEPPELKYLSDHLEIFLKRDFLRFLPNEVCMYLLSWLDPVSLGRCCLVSKAWNEAVTSCQPVWRQACRRIGWKIDDSKAAKTQWKKEYVRALTRIKQLKNGSAFEEGYLLGHAARVYAVKFDGSKLLASGSDDRTVRLWDVTTGECLQTILTHTCADLAFDSYFVYTASFDNTVSCWKWNTGELMRTYRGHTGAVFSISYDEERDLLVSGSADKTIRLWQLSTGVLINMYHGHQEWVTKVILQKCNVESLHHKPGDFVILSMDKAVIKIWVISREVNCECLYELSVANYKGPIPSYLSAWPIHEAEIGHVCLYPKLIFTGSRIMCSSDKGLLEWDFRDYTLTRVTPHPKSLTFLLGAGNSMLLVADTFEDRLFFIKPQGSVMESQARTLRPQASASSSAFLSPSPDTVDYEQDAIPCSSSGYRPVVLPHFSSQPARDVSNNAVTPTDESVEIDMDTRLSNQDDDLVSDINSNNIKSVVVSGENSINEHFENPIETNRVYSAYDNISYVLGKWELPPCRWSKRGSNFVCGDQSWLNGFSDVNNSGLVFAATLPNHSIYILRWSD